MPTGTIMPMFSEICPINIDAARPLVYKRLEQKVLAKK